MSISDLIQLLSNRIAFNAQQRQAAVLRGDVSYVTSLDADTATTQATLDALQVVQNG
jgi:hypothetical protein